MNASQASAHRRVSRIFTLDALVMVGAVALICGATFGAYQSAILNVIAPICRALGAH